MRSYLACIAGLLAALPLLAVAAPTLPDRTAIDAEVARLMAASQAQGLALAVIHEGRVVHVAAYGKRNAAGEPLQTDTVMYGASLTKAVFGQVVMQLVEAGRLDLDKPLVSYLDKPLPDYPRDSKYGPWHHLAKEPRWRQLTARMLLTHSGGFANFAFLEPDGRLRMHFDPGTRYAYSGEGLILLQFVLEKGLGLDIGDEAQRRVFTPLGMTRTSLMWRADFRPNLADGWTEEGKTEPHDERSRVRVAGSMDTTIADMARFAAGYISGMGLSPAGAAELTKAHLPITTASQFPTLQPELPPAQRRADLAAGLGVVTFTGPQGPAFFKGGHNDSTGNTWVCVKAGQRCVVILANDVRAERAFPRLVEFILGETGTPWRWEYGAKDFVK
ncbi:serine hydrolase domain-containing protein [Roseateles asaccharophilus]|uniref:CubicO group peptidase (Beta-lactamase class C family) n=1 Tax=Roseateles asaccharophilus TaxID=582607 RepID=A0ABU2A302_9BURK|nr:serine hydrolase domain-containing protein [Roseateles asaccharophilus]MDR7331567.1 CubicO group peptidase (beta-lactamase class C family) [Roseateles asaccharophilus]